MMRTMTSRKLDELSRCPASGTASQRWWTLEQERTSCGPTSATTWRSKHRPEEGIGSVELEENEAETMDRGRFKVRMAGGRTAKSKWQVADVKRPLMSMAKMIAAGNCVQLDESDHRVVKPSGDIIPLRNAGYVFVMDLWVKRDAIGNKPGSPRQA